jgi:hypothetical protein
MTPQIIAQQNYSGLQQDMTYAAYKYAFMAAIYMCQTQVPNAVGEVRTQFKCLVLLLGAI